MQQLLYNTKEPSCKSNFNGKDPNVQGYKVLPINHYPSDHPICTRRVCPHSVPPSCLIFVPHVLLPIPAAFFANYSRSVAPTSRSHATLGYEFCHFE